MAPPRVHRIDVRRGDGRRIVSAYAVDDVLIDPGPASGLPSLLEAINEPPRALLLTHVHLDHAAAAGVLVARWPQLEVWVHDRGARHVVDPARLVQSAGRLRRGHGRAVGRDHPGTRGQRRAARRRASARRLPRPADARARRHHISFVHQASGVAFVGDVAGVRIEHGPVLPPVPPPDIDLDAWERSLQALERQDPAALALGHFGVHHDVASHLARLREALGGLGRDGATPGEAAFTDRVRRQLRAGVVDAGHRDDYVFSLALEHAHAGLRHWQSRPPVR